jgi:Uncharacterized conserved protein
MAGKRGVLAELDLSLKLTPKEEQARIAAAQERLLQLRLVLGGLIGGSADRAAGLRGLRGWDASGKGGAIKRLVGPLDPRHVRVAQFGAPSYDEKRHHFLWRFWPALPGWAAWRCWTGPGTAASWSNGSRDSPPRGSGGAPTRDRRVRADAGRRRHDHDQVLAAPVVRRAARRFKAREQDPLKTWKLTAEDWRNRGKRRRTRRPWRTCWTGPITRPHPGCSSRPKTSGGPG